MLSEWPRRWPVGSADPPPVAVASYDERLPIANCLPADSVAPRADIPARVCVCFAPSSQRWDTVVDVEGRDDADDAPSGPSLTGHAAEAGFLPPPDLDMCTADVQRLRVCQADGSAVTDYRP